MQHCASPIKVLEAQELLTVHVAVEKMHLDVTNTEPIPCGLVILFPVVQVHSTCAYKIRLVLF